MDENQQGGAGSSGKSPSGKNEESTDALMQLVHNEQEQFESEDEQSVTVDSLDTSSNSELAERCLLLASDSSLQSPDTSLNPANIEKESSDFNLAPVSPLLTNLSTTSLDKKHDIMRESETSGGEERFISISKDVRQSKNSKTSDAEEIANGEMSLLKRSVTGEEDVDFKLETNDHFMVMKENDSLKSRIEEMERQLQKADSRIDNLKATLSVYEGDDEMKNPKLVLSKLTTKETENASLKEEVAHQNVLLFEAEEKQKELSNEIAQLIKNDQEKFTSLGLKDLEVERLEVKVAELTSAFQSRSSELNDRNGISQTNKGNASVRSSSINIRAHSRVNKNSSSSSKFCVIL